MTPRQGGTDQPPIPHQRISNTEIYLQVKLLEQKIDNHLTYHAQMIEAAKEIADKRYKLYVLVVSVASLLVTGFEALIHFAGK